MSNITLSAGIRNNLLSLQQTAADLATTQEQLSTGKKVNTAFDNPQSYFTSQSLTNRANDLSSLLDQIGQAQQTLNAANDGLTALTSLLQQALSTAQQAQQSTTGTVNYTNITGGVAIAADTTQVTGTSTVANAIATAGITASTQSTVSIDATGLAALTVGNTLTFKLGSGATVTATFGTSNTSSTDTFKDAAGLASVLASGGAGNLSTQASATVSGGGVTVTSNDLTNNFAAIGGTNAVNAVDLAQANFSLGSGLTISDGTHNETAYYVASNANAANNTFTTAAQLVGALNNAASPTNATITASTTAGGLTLASSGAVTVQGALGAALGFGTATNNGNYNAQLAAIASGSTLTVQVGSSTAHTITFGAGAGEVATKAALTTALAGFTDIGGAFTGGNDLQFTPSSTSPVTIGGSPSAVTAFGLSLGTTTPTATVVTASTTRSILQGNFNSLLTQIDQLAGDASYNGVNLLTGNNLTVNFNENGTSGLTIAGVKDTSAGLGLGAQNANQFQDNNAISTVVGLLNSAITTVRAQTESFGTNSSTISTRQSFETNIINTLQTGASNLVLADQNQASANLLTEQTRQQLEISSLSIANQANQAVLKLFP
jgi:flagellin